MGARRMHTRRTPSEWLWKRKWNMPHKYPYRHILERICPEDNGIKIKYISSNKAMNETAEYYYLKKKTERGSQKRTERFRTKTLNEKPERNKLTHYAERSM